MVARFFCIVVFIWAGLVTHLPAQTLAEMQKWHVAAEKGGLAAADKAIQQFEEVLARNPQNELARVYLGSSQTLRSRALGYGPEKLRTLRLGGELMDAAVTAAPDDPRVRLIRAVNFLQIPTLFGKRDIAHADFDILLKAVREKPGDLTPDERGAIYYFGGISQQQRKRKTEAVEAWQTGLKIAEDRELIGLLKKKLK